MSEAELPLFPFDTPLALDTDPEHARLRRDDPVPRVRLAPGGQAYLATRYDDVKRVFGEPVFSRAAATEPGVPSLRPTRTNPYLLLSMDPPEHTRMRKLVARAFTVRAVERMRPRVQQLADGLVDAMLATGPPADFVVAFAAPLPATVISDMLGAPRLDHDRLRVWLDAVASISTPDPEELRATAAQFPAYVARLVEAKRAEPAEDLLTALIQAHDEGDRLSEPELVATAYLLLAAGYETTRSLLIDSIVTLSRHPEQLALLKDKPELIPDAVEELLRYVPIIRAALERLATEDVKLGGVRVPAGSVVIPLNYSANRDPALADDPDRFDVTRKPTPHLAFGHGIHHCLGAPLARLEMQTALATLLRRLPGLRLAVPESELVWKPDLLTRTPAALPVIW